MGAAELIAFEEVRARKHWDTLRQQLHVRFDQWLDTLEQQWHEPPSRFHRIPLKISPTQPPDGARGGPHTLTARGAV